MAEHVSRLLEKLPRPIDFDRDAILDALQDPHTRIAVGITFLALLLIP